MQPLSETEAKAISLQITSQPAASTDSSSKTDQSKIMNHDANGGVIESAPVDESAHPPSQSDDELLDARVAINRAVEELGARWSAKFDANSENAEGEVATLLQNISRLELEFKIGIAALKVRLEQCVAQRLQKRSAVILRPFVVKKGAV